MIKRLLCVAGLYGSLNAHPALACQWEFAPEPIQGPSASFIAPRMAAQATFIDVVMAEGASAVKVPPGARPGASQALSFRVLKRLKGRSADRFILFGNLGEAKPGGDWGMTHWVDKEGRIYPHASLHEGSVTMLESMSSCDPPQLSVAPGRVYVVLREADGRLLGRVKWHEGMETAGTPIALASLINLDDFTFKLIQSTDAFNRDKLPEPVDSAEPGRATIVLRRPLELEGARALLKTAGAVPYGAVTSRGGVTSDYRLRSDYAFERLLEDALLFADGVATSPKQLKALAEQMVEGFSAATFDDYDPSFGIVPAIVAVAESKEQGKASFVAIDVVADAAAQARLARNTAVLRVEPARRVRLAVAAGTVDPVATALPVRSELFPRLTRLSGKVLAPATVDGRWRVIGSYELFKTVPLNLDLNAGVVAATADCFGSVRGRYTLDGLVLKLRLAKPDLTKCPKTMEYWSLEYLFGDKDFTVRAVDSKLRLEGSAGSVFTFER
ncbi:hypothetical protein GCM10022280_09390 [Sphingomonas swuensis]|uniref:DUF306 domain-containing protein n=1 Tax=Sphingomonas swuensis TaxID=977800 RepID=A0ABP7SLU5_9SPHN